MNYVSVLLRSCFPGTSEEDDDRMYNAVSEAVAFRQGALVQVADVDQLPDVRYIQDLMKWSQVDLVVSNGKVFLLRTVLVSYQRTLADLAAFEQCVEECLGLFTFFGARKLLSSKFDSRSLSTVFFVVAAGNLDAADGRSCNCIFGCSRATSCEKTVFERC